MATIPLSQVVIASFGPSVLIGIKDHPPMVSIIPDKDEMFSKYDLDKKHINKWLHDGISNTTCDESIINWINDNWNNLEIPQNKTILMSKGKA